MNIKRYRAASMREALESAKRELGEDALVIETRRVRAGGVLGLGGRELVEVSIADDDSSAKTNAKTDDAGSGDRRSAKRASGRSILNLSDDAPATPRRDKAPAEKSGASTLSALVARNYAQETYKPSAQNFGSLFSSNASALDASSANGETPSHPVQAKAGPAKNQAETNASATTGFAERTAPRKAQESAPRAQQTTTSAQTATQPATLNHELERLRAELREVKFSLGTLIARPQHAQPAAFDLSSANEDDLAIFDSPFYEAYLALTSAAFTPELARRVVRAALAVCGQDASDPAQAIRAGLNASLPSIVSFGADPLTRASGAGDAPHAIALVGPTGVGKTTTIAKIAARAALRERRRVELITLDTYRIAAVEQLRTYAEVIGAGFHVTRSMVELDALTRRLSSEAVVLIDTTGRSPHDLADQTELADYLRANESILKCLVMQATTHPDDALVAARKFAFYGAGSLVITKLDETSRPGCAVRFASEAALPLVYLCAGQRVPEDFEPATAESFAAHVVRTDGLAFSA